MKRPQPIIDRVPRPAVMRSHNSCPQSARREALLAEHYRAERRMSAEQLANAVSGLGLRYTRTQVSNLESGRVTMSSCFPVRTSSRSR